MSLAVPFHFSPWDLYTSHRLYVFPRTSTHPWLTFLQAISPHPQETPTHENSSFPPQSLWWMIFPLIPLAESRNAILLWYLCFLLLHLVLRRLLFLPHPTSSALSESHYTPEWWFWKSDPPTWKLVRNIDFLSPPQTYRNRNSGSGASQCVF